MNSSEKNTATDRNKILPANELNKFLRYELNTGLLYWLPRPLSWFKTEGAGKAWNKRFAGAQAFTGDMNGYRHGAINGKMYAAHRVAWALYYGYWPENTIDHINGIKNDNRIINLRDVSNAINSRNAKMRSSNVSGYNGVAWYEARGKWIANIMMDGKRKHLGLFVDIEDAISARKAAEVGQNYTKRHGVKAET